MTEYIDTLPSDWIPETDSIIKVIGVGGGGCNAVDYMYRQKIEGCTFVVCNTDAQALNKCDVPVKIQLGEGLGAGTDPTAGRATYISPFSSAQAPNFTSSRREKFQRTPLTSSPKEAVISLSALRTVRESAS